MYQRHSVLNQSTYVQWHRGEMKTFCLGRISRAVHHFVCPFHSLASFHEAKEHYGC